MFLKFNERFWDAQLVSDAVNGARSARAKLESRFMSSNRRVCPPLKSSTYVLQRVEWVDNTIDKVLDCSRIARAIKIAIGIANRIAKIILLRIAL